MLTRRRGISTMLALTLAVSSGAVAGEEVEMPGIEIGQKAPEFKLKDQEGKTRTLSEFLRGGKTVALVFYRSADW